MTDSPKKFRALKTIDEQAAAWVLRCDRGLTPSEQDDFSHWLAVDPRHGAALARHRRHWRRLDSLAQWRPEHSAQPNPDLLAPPVRKRTRQVIAVSFSLAAAAALVLGWIAWRPIPSGEPAAAAIASAEPDNRRHVLADGSVVELNRGAAITTHLGKTERRVTLERGEAHFTVAKDAARPFIVAAGGVEVRAIGTAFNVRSDAAVVEVLVTEGRVRLDSIHAADSGSPTAATASPPPDETPVVASLVPVLEARQRAIISISPQPAPPPIATLTTHEIERVLAWRHRLLEFDATPLSEIVAEFNRRNGVQLVLADDELASIRISASFRSDNIDGFLRLLELGFNAHAEHRGTSEILLRKKN